MKGRLEDAKRALCHAADVNKTTLPLSLLDKVRGARLIPSGGTSAQRVSPAQAVRRMVTADGTLPAAARGPGDCGAGQAGVSACPRRPQLQLPRKKKAKASILDFCGNRHLRKVTLVMVCVW